MKLVVFGLTVSSSWGNGHATLWRGLCGALARMRHEVVFFERDLPYYASHRDLSASDAFDLRLYGSWDDVRDVARAEVDGADAVLVTSYCPDGVAATELALASRARVKVFYDLDTPVTLAMLEAGQAPPYIAPAGLGGFDLVLSYTGGAALDGLAAQLGARRVAPLYGSVDPAVHRPVPPDPRYAADLSYLGTFAADRQAALEALFLAPARHAPRQRFLLAGAQYPADCPWGSNVFFKRHLPPDQHAAFYASSRLTLNVTREAMRAMGHCPSGRLFEAAASGAAILSDSWAGLERFFTPGSEILLARTTADALEALARTDEELAGIARRGRERTLDEHTAMHRARELVEVLERVARREPTATRHATTMEA